MEEVQGQVNLHLLMQQQVQLIQVEVEAEEKMVEHQEQPAVQESLS